MRKEDLPWAEINGIRYDAATAYPIHHRDTLWGGRRILAITPDNYFFAARHIGVFYGWAFYPLRCRYWAIEEALAMRAPDDVLELLDVRVLNADPDPPKFNLLDVELLCIVVRRGGLREALLRDPRGNFWLFRCLGRMNSWLGIASTWVRPISQRRALKWAIRCLSHTSKSARVFGALGVADPCGHPLH